MEGQVTITAAARILEAQVTITAAERYERRSVMGQVVWIMARPSSIEDLQDEGHAPHATHEQVADDTDECASSRVLRGAGVRDTY